MSREREGYVLPAAISVAKSKRNCAPASDGKQPVICGKMVRQSTVRIASQGDRLGHARLAERIRCGNARSCSCYLKRGVRQRAMAAKCL